MDVVERDWLGRCKEETDGQIGDFELFDDVEDDAEIGFDLSDDKDDVGGDDFDREVLLLDLSLDTSPWARLIGGLPM